MEAFFFLQIYNPFFSFAGQWDHLLYFQRIQKNVDHPIEIYCKLDVIN